MFIYVFYLVIQVV